MKGTIIFPIQCLLYALLCFPCVKPTVFKNGDQGDILWQDISWKGDTCDEEHCMRGHFIYIWGSSQWDYFTSRSPRRVWALSRVFSNFFTDFIQPFGEDFLYGFLSTVSCPSIKFSLIWGNEGMLKRTFVREPHVYSMIMTNHGWRKRPWGALGIILRPPWQSANFLRKQIYNFLWIMLSEADN